MHFFKLLELELHFGIIKLFSSQLPVITCVNSWENISCSHKKNTFRSLSGVVKIIFSYLSTLLGEGNLTSSAAETHVFVALCCKKLSPVGEDGLWGGSQKAVGPVCSHIYPNIYQSETNIKDSNPLSLTHTHTQIMTGRSGCDVCCCVSCVMSSPVVLHFNKFSFLFNGATASLCKSRSGCIFQFSQWVWISHLLLFYVKRVSRCK